MWMLRATEYGKANDLCMTIISCMAEYATCALSSILILHTSAVNTAQGLSVDHGPELRKG
jgi:hypothetical protein